MAAQSPSLTRIERDWGGSTVSITRTGTISKHQPLINHTHSHYSQTHLDTAGIPQGSLSKTPALAGTHGTTRVLVVENLSSSSADFLIRNTTGVLISNNLRDQYKKMEGKWSDKHSDILVFLSKHMDNEIHAGWVVDGVITSTEKKKALVLIKKVA